MFQIEDIISRVVLCRMVLVKIHCDRVYVMIVHHTGEEIIDDQLVQQH